MDSLINLLYSLNIDKAEVLDYIDRLKHVSLKKHEHFQMQGNIAKYMGYVGFREIQVLQNRQRG
jgi:uncharacterized protein YktA (UPF0223 family)